MFDEIRLDSNQLNGKKVHRQCNNGSPVCGVMARRIIKRCYAKEWKNQYVCFLPDYTFYTCLPDSLGPTRIIASIRIICKNI